MRRNEKSKIANRIWAVVLSIMMVLSLMPVSMLSVLAATPEHLDAVTITVKDENGEPLSGATVAYTIDSVINGAGYQENILITDDYGTVEVLASSDYVEGDLSISATVSKTGYTTDSATISNNMIIANDQNFDVSISCMSISGITVTPTSVEFSEDDKGNAVEHDAVSVSGTETDDKVTYSISGGNFSENVPKISAVGTYSVTVKVERAGYDDYIATVTAEIKKGNLTVNVIPLTRPYEENTSSNAVSVSGTREGDVVTYRLGDGEESLDVPQIENVGTYNVTVKVHRNDNYNDFENIYTAEITSIDIEGLSATLYSGTYDGNEHDAILEVNGTIEGDIVEYQLNEGIWSEDIPKIKNAGEYHIAIRVRRNANYNETTIINLNPSTVMVGKADQNIEFSNYEAETTLSFDTEDLANNVFDFSAVGGALAAPIIMYSLENDSESDTTDIAEIAEIDADGKLTVKKAGYNIKVIATVAGDSNYKDTSVECHVTVPNQTEDLILFTNETESYRVGTNVVISNQTAIKAYDDDNGTITYSAKVNDVDVSSQDLGISINTYSGTVTADYEKLSNALVSNGNSLTIVVTANKTAGTKKQKNSTDFEGKDKEVYVACETTYNVNVSFEAAPANVYQLKDPDGVILTGPNGTNNWFNTAVTVVPATEGYSIAKDSASGFGDSVEFDNQGNAVRKIYLQNISTGGITAPVTVDVKKIDSVEPDSNKISIEYSEPVINRLLWFYDGPVTITFTAYDVTSGVDTFTWQYNRSADASTSNLASDHGTVDAVQDTEDPTKYTGKLTLPKSEVQQLRGCISVHATDKAGLSSEEKKDDGRIIVIDTISPEIEQVMYQLKNAEGTTQIVDDRYYFSDDVEVTFKVKEANFFPEDVVVKVSTDGRPATILYPVEWKPDINDSDIHWGTYKLENEGENVVTMEYVDRMAHKDGKYVEADQITNQRSTVAYTSEKITIDRTPPVIEFRYSNDNNTSADSNNAQTATVKVTERNFRASDLEVKVIASDINGSDVDVKDLQSILRNAEWDNESGTYVHTTTISEELLDAIYNLTFNYKDLALNPAVEVNTGKFIVDHTAPDTATMKVTYSTPLTEKIYSVVQLVEKAVLDVTYSYYNPNYNPDNDSDYEPKVTVKFEAVDMTSGVDFFTYSYAKEEGASEINVASYADTKLSAEQDETDKSKFTASVTLPKEAAEQLRGNITFSATDKYSNKSHEVTDTNHVIVSDTKAPKLTNVEYTEPSREVGNKKYYNKDVTATFTIEEANFYSEDVIVELSTNGGEFTSITPNWTDRSVDVHEGTFTIAAPNDHSCDADYVFRVTYADRSKNPMVASSELSEDAVVSEDGVYTSPVIVIDTKDPILEFKYSNDNNVSLSDKDNDQKVIITVDEHNFRANDISLEMTARNIKKESVMSNDEIRSIEEYLQADGNWNPDPNNADIHILELPSGEGGILKDAIYEMTLHYQDLATNKIKEDNEENAGVKSNVFIIDHVAPDMEKMKVTYSTPLTEKVISTAEIVEKLYGYYNPTFRPKDNSDYDPQVTVKFEAVDMVSGVDKFTWSYRKEAGASDKNVESYLNQTLSAEQDTRDSSIFTAFVTLPLEEAEQLRGNITFSATDKYSNQSGEIADTTHVIVSDSIAPELKDGYTEPSRSVGSRMYYNKDVTATFTINEANFYPEDVEVTLSKDGADPVLIPINWKHLSKDDYEGTYTIKAPSDHSGDGDYYFEVTYTDRSKNEMSYTSNEITIDTEKPIVRVAYSNNNAINILNDAENHTRKYLDETQTAKVTIKEHNFEEKDVQFTILAKDSTGKELDADNLIIKTAWEPTEEPDTYEMTITYPGDANYTFDVEYADLATNKADDYKPDYFTVDKTAPENLTVSYSNSVLDTILQTITFGFYNAQMTVTITADDSTAGVQEFKYDYTLASGVSSVNAELINQAIEEAGITYTNGRKTATTEFNIPKAALGNSNQFNGTVSFVATDRVKHKSTKFNDTKRIVVDNISPTSEVSYNTPLQVSGGVSYYDGPVNATVTVNEANFYSEDVQISATKDGASYPVTTNWSDNSTDVHVGTFTLSDDGDYIVTINYADKSGNSMATYTSEQMTVDTQITQPTITVNGEEANGKAFKEDVIPAVSFEDKNFDNYEIKLSRTRYDDKNVDVTETFIGNNVSVNEQGGTGSFDTFVKEQDVDGIYTMTVSMTDKAGHSTESSATFTVNRFGSVYEYDDYLSSLIKDGGAYVQKVENNLVITEYNADRLVSGSLDIEILKDGKPLSDVDYKSTPQINDQVAVGSSGWYQYEYTIAKENFDSDGVYKISVSSKDATGNTPEITNYEDKNILFRVDSTAPEIDSITGLEKDIINAQNVTAKYTVYDTIGLSSINVYVDGEVVDTITDFSEDMNNYSGSFTVSEKNSAQKVRLVVEDLAGNVTDTDSEEFASAYAFSKAVTVSTNAFVRFYANKPLFWGSIGGVVVIGTAATYVLQMRRRKKNIEL